MKHVKLMVIIIPIAFLISCSGNNGSSAVKSSDDDNPSELVSPEAEAHFSCVVDGQPVSGGAIDQMQFYNTAGIQDIDKGKELLFYLADTKSSEASSLFIHSLRFSIPAKTGSISFGPDEDGWGVEVDIKSDKDHQATYFSDSFTVNVSSLSSARTSGTFSGKFKIREDALSSNYKKEIEVSDGKFDIPMRK
ncbi:MAG: hypothetical protein ABI091_29365 [Ferruginibacter sp.]